MKPIVLVTIIALSLLTISCKKENHAGDNPGQLVAISSDSAGTYGFVYTGSQITGLTKGSPDKKDLIGNYQYLQNLDSGGIITTFDNDADSISYSYALTQTHLPLWILVGVTYQGGYAQNEVADFFYESNSDVLDSAMFFSWGNTYLFKMSYNGPDIAEIDESVLLGISYISLCITKFSYGNTKNAFRATDSLLYIYTYPSTVTSAQDLVQAAFFAETFSVHTFNWVTIHSSTFGNYTFPATITVNGAGQVIRESFDDPSMEKLCGKTFIYK